MVRAVLKGWLTGSGFNPAWFSSVVFRALPYLLSSWCCVNLKYFVTFFTLLFVELSLVGLAIDLAD